ncbi:hypothetical protein GCM10009860_04370 [Microbacterium mitrae]|uniref:Uncharacterized protein n=1 Tax=Microbacterium mitrae TaxID=664640 RepID=A0A5C8HPC4_9MICO|nr:hypothetical protein [Microbacterium mitrae]TXK05835.1 hypothetical protein FVP60_02290 [Microbacterium mitrae]
MSDATNVPEAADHVLKTRSPLWMMATVTGIFGLAYAYTVFSAIGALLQQASGPYPLTATGWTVLIAAVVVPVIIFTAVVSLGIRRLIGEYTMMLLAGYALAQVYWMNTLSLMLSSGCSFVSGNPFCG